MGEGSIWLIVPKNWSLAMVHTCNLVPGKKRQDKCLVYTTRPYLKIIRDVACW